MDTKQRRRLLPLLAPCALALIALSSCARGGARPEHSIVILYTNDVHCAVDENIGYAGLALQKRLMLEETPFVTLVDAGDAVQGGAIGALSRGESIITLMNEVGYDVAVPGNHEFDYGMERTAEFARNLSCGYIACNFMYAEKNRVFPAYKIIEHGKTKVAFVGVCTPETMTKTTPATFMGADGTPAYTFGAEDGGAVFYASAQDAIDSARRDGAHFVILVAHLGESGPQNPWSAQSLVARTSGADALIDGHSHQETPALAAKDKDGKTVIITQSGARLRRIGKLTISRTGTLSAELVSAVPAKDGTAADAKVHAKIEDIRNSVSATLGRRLGASDFPLRAGGEDGAPGARVEETNLGDFVADAFRAAHNADIALINGGGLRRNIGAGDITHGDILSLLPFWNTVRVYEMPGKTILDELEFGARMLPEAFGGFLHVSGLSFSVDMGIPSSAKTDENGFFAGVEGPYRVRDVRVGGAPLEADKTYTVASTDFIVEQRGDGHLFNGAKRLPGQEGRDIDVVSAYIESFPEKIPGRYKDPRGQGRIAIEKERR